MAKTTVEAADSGVLGREQRQPPDTVRRWRPEVRLLHDGVGQSLHPT